MFLIFCNNVGMDRNTDKSNHENSWYLCRLWDCSSPERRICSCWQHLWVSVLSGKPRISCDTLYFKRKRNLNNPWIIERKFMLKRPLELGADMSYYSMTKYMNGHSDVIMGSVALNDSGLADRLRFLQNATGAVPSPFDCYLVNRRWVTHNIFVVYCWWKI